MMKQIRTNQITFLIVVKRTIISSDFNLVVYIGTQTNKWIFNKE